MAKNKLFVVQKYIYAVSAEKALKLERKSPVDEIFIDSDWKKTNIDKDSAIGFVPPLLLRVKSGDIIMP